MEGIAVLACFGQRIDGLLSVTVGLAVEPELLHKADSDLLVDRVVLCNAYPELVPRDASQGHQSSGPRAVFQSRWREDGHRVGLAVVGPALGLLAVGSWENLLERKRERHRSSYSWLTVEPDTTMHHVLDNGLAD